MGSSSSSSTLENSDSVTRQSQSRSRRLIRPAASSFFRVYCVSRLMNFTILSSTKWLKAAVCLYKSFMLWKTLMKLVSDISVIDNISDGLIAHDLERKIFFFNKAAEQITGYINSRFN